MVAEKSSNKDLRARAEAKFKKIPYSLSNLSNEKAKELFHEIEVHQIELEMQNQELREIQHRLEEARDLYTDLFDFAPVGYLLLNEKGVITNINLTGCAMLGEERSQIKGRPFSAYLSKNESQKLYLKLQEAFNTGTFFPIDLEIKHKTKNTITVVIHGTLNHNSYSRSSICHVSIQDVTELRKIEKLKQQYHDLEHEKEMIQQYLDLAPIIFLLVNNKQQVQLINKKGSDVLGYSLQEVLGKNWFKDYILPLDKNDGDYTYYNFEYKKLLWAPYFECEVICKNGERKLIAWTNNTIFNEDGSILATLSAGEDITERKKLELNQLEYTEELEQIVKERTKRLSDALKNERQINEMKSAFISIASHELRTPITIVMSSTILIEKYLKAGLYANQQKHIDRIKESVHHFISILDDFLSLDKLERGIMVARKDRFDLKELIEKSIEELEEICKKNQKIKFTYKGHTDVILDQKIIRNILMNLLTNAIKYSEKDIKLDAVHSHHLVTIKVKDKGIGIPEDEQKYLFSRFFRGKNVQNIPGTGLGLSIVKRYVDLLEGSIQFKSKINVGSTFTLLFPQDETTCQ